MPAIDIGKAGSIEDFDEFRSCVAAMMPNRAVNIAKDSGAGGDLQNKASARGQRAVDALKHRAIVFDVLNNLQHDGGVKALGPVRGGGVDKVDRDVGTAQICRACLLDKRCVDIDRGHMIGQFGEVSGERPGTAADLQRASPDVGLDRGQNPTIVGSGRLQARQPGRLHSIATVFG